MHRVDDLIERCRGSQLPVILVSLASGFSEEGVIVSQDRSTIRIRLPDSTQGHMYRRASPVCLTMRMGADTHAMVVPVERLDTPNLRRDHHELVVGKPNSLSTLECRQFIRHDVAASSQLRATMIAADARHRDLRVLELGQRDMVLEVPGTAGSYPRGMPITLELTHRGRTLSLGSKIKRPKRGAYVVRFVEPEDNRILDAQLQRLVARIERESLRSQRQSA